MMRKQASWWCTVFSVSLLIGGVPSGLLAASAATSKWVTYAGRQSSVPAVAAVHWAQVVSPRVVAAATPAATTASRVTASWSGTSYTPPSTTAVRSTAGTSYWVAPGGSSSTKPPSGGTTNPPAGGTTTPPSGNAAKQAVIPATVIKCSDAPCLNGFVFIDANRNGRKDLGEWAIANAAVTLNPQTPGLPSVTVTTAKDGSYHFGKLAPGLYDLSQVHPLMHKVFMDGADSVGTFVKKNGKPFLKKPPASELGVAATTANVDLIQGIRIRANWAGVVGNGYAGQNFNFAEVSLDPKYSVRPTKGWYTGTTLVRTYTLPPPEPVPEPSTWVLLIAGGAMIAGVAWRKRRS